MPEPWKDLKPISCDFSEDEMITFIPEHIAKIIFEEKISK